jgi:hypothetical protein
MTAQLFVGLIVGFLGGVIAAGAITLYTLRRVAKFNERDF